MDDKLRNKLEEEYRNSRNIICGCEEISFENFSEFRVAELSSEFRKKFKERILKDTKIKKPNILKVDSFLNHKLDIKLLKEIGEEFSRRFRNEKIDKIVTIETSGISIATVTAQYFDDVDVLFAKKSASKNLDDDIYRKSVYSFSKNKEYNVMINKEYLKKGENVLILDDFLADGISILALIEILKEAEVNIVGLGIVIEKSYQEGIDKILSKGIKVESLVKIKSLNDNIEFME